VSQNSTGLDILTVLSPQYLTLHMVSKIKYQILADFHLIQLCTILLFILVYHADRILRNPAMIQTL